MCKVLVYHTERNICLLLKSLLKENVTKFDEYYNYDRSGFIDLAESLQPDFVFIKRRYNIDETGSIIHCFKHISPKSKFFIIAQDAEECKQIKQQLVGEFDEVIDEKRMDTEVTYLIENYLTKIDYAPIISASYIEKLTKTEKLIYDYLRQGNKPREIAKILGKKYNTVRKHIQNMYAKAGIHNYKGFMN